MFQIQNLNFQFYLFYCVVVCGGGGAGLVLHCEGENRLKYDDDWTTETTKVPLCCPTRESHRQEILSSYKRRERVETKLKD